MDRSSHRRHSMQDTKLTNILPHARLTVRLANNKFGRPQPELRIEGIEKSDHRRVLAAVYLIAMRIELATGAADAWCVVPNADDYCVQIELHVASPEETERAVTMLREICDRAEA
jgi:hypothetical protein